MDKPPKDSKKLAGSLQERSQEQSSLGFAIKKPESALGRCLKLKASRPYSRNAAVEMLDLVGDDDEVDNASGTREKPHTGWTSSSHGRISPAGLPVARLEARADSMRHQKYSLAATSELSEVERPRSEFENDFCVPDSSPILQARGSHSDGRAALSSPRQSIDPESGARGMDLWWSSSPVRNPPQSHTTLVKDGESLFLGKYSDDMTNHEDQNWSAQASNKRPAVIEEG